MDFGHPTAEWNQLLDKYYRKREIYEMLWENIDLSKYRVVGAPNGGPIALVRDDKKIILVDKNNQLKPMVRIFSSAGKQLGSFLWGKGKIVGMGWTEYERLLIVVEDGTVFQYNLHGKLHKEFDFGKEVKDQRVLDVRFWGEGIVVMTAMLQFYVISNLEEVRVHRLAQSGLDQIPTSWAIIEPRNSLSRTVEVFIGTKGGTILVLDRDGCQDQLLSQGPFTCMAVTEQFVACFTQSGDLCVFSIDFSKLISQFGTKSKIPPQQLVWCGRDSVILYWDKIILMVGPKGDWLKYSYDEALHLISECDGVRIITKGKCEFLHCVPTVTENIFKIGSTMPAAMLYDALEHFEKKSPKADDNIRSIKNELSDAVDACIEAAAHEFDHRIQRQLLKAASFGKCFMEFYMAENFVEVARILRVLNAVRNSEIGIPLTYLQFKAQSPEILIERLVLRHHHLLAWRICNYLGLRGERVLIHWACAKVKANQDDGAVCAAIVNKLQAVPGISFAEIASTAYQNGRQELATKLLEYEPRAADQVPLLISMKEIEVALQKAIESGDTDLVYLVLLQMKKLPMEHFFGMLKNKPVALNLLIAYCKEQDLELLKAIYYHSNRLGSGGMIRITEAYGSNSLGDRIHKMEAGLKLLRASKTHSFHTKVTEDQIRLLLQQRELESDLKTPYVDLSLSDTIYKLVQNNQDRKASSLKSQFKVPDERFWWIKARALAHKKDWDSLFAFAKSKKSPIGYRPFADLCIENGAKHEAITYIPRLNDPEMKIQYFIKVSCFKDAADVAYKELKDGNAMQQILKRCTNPDHKAYIESLLRQMQRNG